MNPIPGVLDAIDRFQQGHRPAAFAFAVNQKYSDDRGGYLAALITYYGFLSIFPLLLAFFTIAAYTLDPGTIHTLTKHLGSYPIIGTSLGQLANKQLSGSPIALVVGLLGLIWGGQGLSQTLQYSMAEVHNVPNRDRPGFVPRLLIGLRWYATFGVGFLASTFVSSLGNILHWGPAGPVLSSLLALAINVLLFSASFKILSPHEEPWRSVLPGAVFAGLVWTILTGVGIGLLTSLSGGKKSELYGSFGITLGLLAFLYLAARITLYAAEANVVHSQHLWPRALRKRPQTVADVRQLEDMAKREERADDQVVSVEFSGPVPVVGGDGSGVQGGSGSDDEPMPVVDPDEVQAASPPTRPG